jgi:hypothetical protein
MKRANMARIQPVLTKLSILKGNEGRLRPEKLGLLAKQLTEASVPAEAVRIKATLARGFDG